MSVRTVCARVRRRVCLGVRSGRSHPEGAERGGRGSGSAPGQSPVEPERRGGGRQDGAPGGRAGALKEGLGIFAARPRPAPGVGLGGCARLLTSADLPAGKLHDAESQSAADRPAPSAWGAPRESRSQQLHGASGVEGVGSAPGPQP